MKQRVFYNGFLVSGNVVEEWYVELSSSLVKLRTSFKNPSTTSDNVMPIKVLHSDHRYSVFHKF